MKIVDNKVLIWIDYSDYLKILEIKTSYKIEIVDRKGISKYKYLFKKYYLFLLFSLMGILLNIFLSNLILEVEVVHSSKDIRNIIYNDLEFFDIKKYKLKVNFLEKEEIIKEILKKEKDDIEWLEIEEVGTKYIVRVEQRKKNKKEVKCNPRNLVAKKSAMITNILADSGEVVKKINDYVLKGDIIISGNIHNKENIVNTRCAKGKVFGEVWYKVSLEIPKKYEEKKKTGKIDYGIEMNFFNKKKVLFSDFKNYDSKRFYLFKDNFFPIGISVSKFYEVEKINKNYTLDNISKDALLLAGDKIKDRLIDGEELISKKVLKKEDKGSKILVEVFIKIKEDITDYQEITEEDLRNELNDNVS